MTSQQKHSGKGKVHLKIRTLTLGINFWRVKAVLVWKGLLWATPINCELQAPGFFIDAKNSWASLLPSCMSRSGRRPRNSGQE